MGVFTTPQPADTNKQLGDLVTRKMNRRDALRALQENAAVEAERVNTEEKLQAIDVMESVKQTQNDKLDYLKGKVAKEGMRHSLVTLENRLYEEGRKEIFNQVIFEMVYNACWVDEEVKEATIQSMYETFNEVVDILTENNIPVDMTGNVSKFIEHVHTAVNEVCKKAATRISEEAMMSKNHVNSKEEIEDMFHFDLNDDESTELDNKLADLGKEDIEQLVKSKVLAVVQDEKAKGQAKTDEIESIKAELAATDDDDVVVDDEIALDNGENPEDAEEDVPMDDSEDISGGMESYVGIEEGNNDKMHKSYYNHVKAYAHHDASKKTSGDESEAHKQARDYYDSEAEKYKNTKTAVAYGMTKDEAEKAKSAKESVQEMIDRKRNLERHRMTGTSLFECLMMANVNSLRNEIASMESLEQSPRNEQVMNAALQESIVVYTAMETLNTLGLCKFDNVNVKRLSDHYKSTLK